MISSFSLQDSAEIARRIAGGMVAVQPFGPDYALVGRPDLRTVRRMNRLAGHAAAEAGSVVTGWCRIPRLFDWSALPEGLESETVMEIIDVLLADGPFGFRGPASPRLPAHLVSEVDGRRTVRMIGPGSGCASNALIEAEMVASGAAWLAIGAPGRRRAEPSDGLIAVHHADAHEARARFPRHAAGPATVLAFHRLGRPDRERRPTLVVERQGSYPVAALAALVGCWGFGLDLAASDTRAAAPARADAA